MAGKATVSDDLKVMRSSLYILGAATEKACLSRLSLVLGTNLCRALGCPRVSERSRYGVKYTEMYLHKNTLGVFKY